MVEVAPTNQGTADAWNGIDGDHWVAHATRYDTALEHYHREMLAAAHLTATDRVLDVGCGNGRSSRDAARAAADGHVLGVDISAQLVANAQRLAREEGITNVTFEQGDAQIYPFDAETFDVVISRFGSMFFGDPLAAFTNIASAMKHDGRLALAVWQPPMTNEFFTAIRGALVLGRELPIPPPGTPGPFAFGDPDRLRYLLTAAGFASIGVEGVRAPMRYGDVEDAIGHFETAGFAQLLLRDLDERERAEARAMLRATVEAHATNDGVVLESAAWIVSATRH